MIGMISLVEFLLFSKLFSLLFHYFDFHVLILKLALGQLSKYLNE
jgi:hypothetical protein